MSVRTRANAPLEPPSADGDPDASERSERGAADNQEALYCWGGPGRMGEIGRERLLCGHTHGGQICLPGGIPVMTDADSPRALARGAWRYHDMAGYTSAGTGTCIVDVRLNCPSASARRAGPEHAAILSLALHVRAVGRRRARGG